MVGLWTPGSFSQTCAGGDLFLVVFLVDSWLQGAVWCCYWSPGMICWGSRSGLVGPRMAVGLGMSTRLRWCCWVCVLCPCCIGSRGVAASLLLVRLRVHLGFPIGGGVQQAPGPSQNWGGPWDSGHSFCTAGSLRDRVLVWACWISLGPAWACTFGVPGVQSLPSMVPLAGQAGPTLALPLTMHCTHLTHTTFCCVNS